MDLHPALWVSLGLSVWVLGGGLMLWLIWAMLKGYIDLMQDIEAQNTEPALRALGWPDERFAEGLLPMPLSPTALTRLQRSYAWRRIMFRIVLWSTPQWLHLSDIGRRARRRLRVSQALACLFPVPFVAAAAWVFPPIAWAAVLFAVPMSIGLLFFRAWPWPSAREV